MKTLMIRILAVLALATLVGSSQAQPDAHYPPGIEGIKGASLPPPGFYLRDYNLFYTADQLNNSSGRSAGPNNFQVLNFANVPRAIWITDAKIFGGYVGVDGLLPLVYQSVKAGPYSSSTFGIGDFFAESTLSWHLKQIDIGAGAGFWAPTGDSAPPPTTRAGAGYWSPMLTLGATYFPDEAKTWAVSVLNRYEFNTKDRDTHETPGQAWTMEWGLSKTVTKTIDCGLVGYYQQRVTVSTGPAPSEFPYSRVAAIGPEVTMAFPSAALYASLRYDYEFMADNRAQGHTVTLTLTKRF